MNTRRKVIAVLILAAAVVAVQALKHHQQTSRAIAASVRIQEPTHLPRLVDLGAGKCIPCKAMAPILEELRETQADRFSVVFIDVWENPEAAKPYQFNLIPTQIFFDKDGKEQWRHEGFLGKEEILAKWKELGVDI